MVMKHSYSLVRLNMAETLVTAICGLCCFSFNTLGEESDIYLKTAFLTVYYPPSLHSQGFKSCIKGLSDGQASIGQCYCVINVAQQGINRPVIWGRKGEESGLRGRCIDGVMENEMMSVRGHHRWNECRWKNQFWEQPYEEARLSHSNSPHCKQLN